MPSVVPDANNLATAPAATVTQYQPLANWPTAKQTQPTALPRASSGNPINVGAP